MCFLFNIARREAAFPSRTLTPAPRTCSAAKSSGRRPPWKQTTTLTQARASLHRSPQATAESAHPCPRTAQSRHNTTCPTLTVTLRFPRLTSARPPKTRDWLALWQHGLLGTFHSEGRGRTRDGVRGRGKRPRGRTRDGVWGDACARYRLELACPAARNVNCGWS